MNARAGFARRPQFPGDLDGMRLAGDFADSRRRLARASQALGWQAIVRGGGGGKRRGGKAPVRGNPRNRNRQMSPLHLFLASFGTPFFLHVKMQFS